MELYTAAELHEKSTSKIAQSHNFKIIMATRYTLQILLVNLGYDIFHTRRKMVHRKENIKGEVERVIAAAVNIIKNEIRCIHDSQTDV